MRDLAKDPDAARAGAEDDVDGPPVRGGGRRAVRPRSHARHHAPVDRPGGESRPAPASRCGRDDLITSTHRGHGHCIAKGADLTRMMAELLAKETGYCRGRGGSMHIADVATGNLGANGIVGGGIPIAVGAALAQQMTGLRQGRRELLRRRRHQRGRLPRGGEPGRGVGPAGGLRLREQPLRHVDGGRRGVRRSRTSRPGPAATASRASPSTATTCRRSTRRSRRRSTGPARAGGPTLVETVTYRWKGHSKSDKNLYRTREEIAAWQEQRPDRRASRTPCARPGSLYRRRDHGRPQGGHGRGARGDPHRERRAGRRRPTATAARRRLRIDDRRCRPYGGTRMTTRPPPDHRTTDETRPTARR